jgi:hypothetical protein
VDSFMEHDQVRSMTSCWIVRGGGGGFEALWSAVDGCDDTEAWSAVDESNGFEAWSVVGRSDGIESLLSKPVSLRWRKVAAEGVEYRSISSAVDNVGRPSRSDEGAGGAIYEGVSASGAGTDARDIGGGSYVLLLGTIDLGVGALAGLSGFVVVERDG